MRSVPMLAAVLLASALFVPARAHATCGAEGCPLVRDGFGASAKRFAFDLRFQNVTQDQLWSGTAKTDLAEVIAGAESHGEVELYTRTRSWVAEGRLRINDDLRLTATLPYIDREHRHWLRHTPVFNPLFLDSWKFQGFADATVIGQYRVLHREGLPAVTLQGGAKLPTGKTHLDDEARNNFGFESTLEPSARPGSGSLDWIAGALVSQSLPGKGVLPLTASVLARWNTKGTDDYQVGNEVQAGLSSGWAPLARVTLLAQVNYSAHDSDVSAQASEAAHSAMKSMYATPGVLVRVSRLVSVYGLYQARVWGKSDEATFVATNHFLVGTTLSLGN